MGNLFGKTKKPPPSRITEQDKAILQLKKQRDKLKQYQKRIEISLAKERLIAKKCLEMGRKDRALLLLKKKKYQEKLLQNTDQQLENLERLASDIEFAQVELQVVDGLRVGNDALKSINEMLDIDEIEKILDETREGADKQSEINSILSSLVTEEDEDDILKELDDLVKTDDIHAAAARDSETDIMYELPEVPDDELPDRVKTTIKSRSQTKTAIAE